MTVELATKKTEENKHASWRETIRTVIFAILLAVTVRSLAFEPFHIPSGSMKSNLLIGDYLFVSKYSYGYSRYSFPLGLPFFSGRIFFSNEPKRGDVVVFRFPPNPRIDYIKRLIGLPGDRVQMKGGVVYINGKALERRFIDDFSDSENNMVKAIPRFTETLPEGKVITILKEKGIDAANNTKEYIVPKGEYFMMGDNRDNSRDSRFEVGFVPAENLIGKAEIIWFSTDGSSNYLNPMSWFSALRTDRFFKRVD